MSSVQVTTVCIKLFGCKYEPEVEEDVCLEALLHIARVLRYQVMGTLFHVYEESGVVGTLLLDDAHLSIRTWPSNEAASLTFVTTRIIDPAAEEMITRAVAESLSYSNFEIALVV